jgi:molybdopterin converting factor small subunit
MMKVRIHLYAQLRDAAGTQQLELDLPEGARVARLLEQLYVKLPALRAHDKSILVGAGVEFVDRAYVIHPDEEIAIMPPVQGG